MISSMERWDSWNFRMISMIEWIALYFLWKFKVYVGISSILLMILSIECSDSWNSNMISIVELIALYFPWIFEVNVRISSILWWFYWLNVKVLSVITRRALLNGESYTFLKLQSLRTYVFDFFNDFICWTLRFLKFSDDEHCGIDSIILSLKTHNLCRHRFDTKVCWVIPTSKFNDRSG